jgi:hypothetical protein
MYPGSAVASPRRSRNGMASNDVAKVVTANREKGGRHSPLYRWMRSHHDALAAAFDADGASWRVVTEMLAENGLTDGDGKQPVIRRAQKTWYRVKRDVAATRAKAEAKSKPSPALAPVVATIPLPSPASPDPWRPDNRAVGTTPPAASDGAPAVAASVEERLRAFRASLNEGKVRIPEPINPTKLRGKTHGET